MSKAAVAAWRPELTGWLRLEKVSHPGLHAQGQEQNSTQIWRECAIKRPRQETTAAQKKEQRATRALAKKEQEEKKEAETLICCEHIQ